MYPDTIILWRPFMKKRGIFSLVLLLALSPLFAAQDITDIGSAYELVIAESTLSDAQTNSASSVSVITQDQIASYNAQTTAELVGKAIGVSYNSYGSLGSLQNVIIRGATSSKNLVFLDGVLLSSAHDASVDLSIIPINIIERIEVVKSGPGNLGRTNAIGGMVNIITKKGQDSETPFSLTFENGSFLPLAYSSSQKRNFLSLVDSQKLDFSYTKEGLIATVGGLVAQNAYTYNDGSANLKLRDNAQVYEAYTNLSYTKDLSKTLKVTTQNFATFKNLGVPGSLSFGLTPDDYMDNTFASTTNTLEITQVSPLLAKLSAQVHYGFGQTFYHDATFGDSTHNKHKASSLIEGTWDLGQAYTLKTDLNYSLDYVDSSDVGQNTRHSIASSAYGSIYFKDGSISLHPSVQLAYLSDLKAVSPNASLGAIFALSACTHLRSTISYAENAPTFSQLYWPFMGNPNLKTEKGLNADFGIETALSKIKYEGTLFGRNIFNDIAYDSSWVPQNIAHSVYLGTEQTLEAELSSLFSIQGSYLYNKSYDLSNGQTFSDNIEVAHIRKHTAKGSVFFNLNRITSALSIEYLGKTNTLDSAVLLNASATVQITDSFKTYVALDNLLNTSYELSSGYPMPGTKIRLGATYRF